MDKKSSREMLLHYAVSAIGGFLGGYAIYNHCDIFGNAQTANLIHLVGKLFSADFSGLIFLIFAFLAFAAGNVFFVIAEKFIKRDVRLISLAMTSCAVLLIGLFPNISNDYVAVLPIFFVTPIQWNAFNTAGGFASSTIFSSNNVRQAVMSLTRYIIDKDSEQGRKAKFFWLTLLSFHSGAALACVTGIFLGVNSVWFCALPIALSFGAYFLLNGARLKKRIAVRLRLKKA